LVAETSHGPELKGREDALALQQKIKKRLFEALRSLLWSGAHISIHPVETVRQQSQFATNSAYGVETT
jgi:chromosome condensin MukBEF MukE localization factor